MVAADEAGLVEALQAVPAGRRREAHPGGQLRLGDAPLRLEDGEDLQVAVVQLHGAAHSRPGRQTEESSARRLMGPSCCMASSLPHSYWCPWSRSEEHTSELQS